VEVVGTVSERRRALAPVRRRGATLGLVPTMGAFHEGHSSLIRRARSECEVVVVSLFVNPTQFGEGEDLSRYPRDLGRDGALAEREGADILFAPPLEEVYPPGFSTAVEVASLGETLCGAPDRRGAEHFRGVATVVTKLLNMCGPDVAYFGAKDFQQSLVVKRLVRDLDIPVRIVVCPIVRDADGLALSSRNEYLSDIDRRRARALKRSLDAGRSAIEGGAREARDVAELVRGELDRAEVVPEYVEVVSARDLQPLDDLEGQEVLIAVAATVGAARLIDNTVVSVQARAEPPPHAVESIG
jgi:pantoate--beta-alanine ligase